MKSKKIINKKNSPAYAFGADLSKYAGISELLGSSMQALSDEGSTVNTAGSALSGAGTGAATGAMFGGVGAAAGAVIGGAVGLASGLFKKKKIDQENKERIAENNYKMGLANEANAYQNYWSDNKLAYTFSNGGMLNNLAYLDNNEIVRDNSGNLLKVPSYVSGTDNNLVNSSNLESVLSNKLRIPGTNTTFAEAGNNIKNSYKQSKGNDVFANNTNALNKYNSNIEYNKLLKQQEELKAKRGIKDKYKNIPTFANGTSMLQAGSIPSLNTDLPAIDYLNYNQDFADSNTTKSFDIGKYLPSSNNILSMVPMIFNMIKGSKPASYEEPIMNPYSSSMLRTMAKRRIDISPQLEANRNSRAIANYNLSQYNTNTGMNLAARTQLAANEYLQNANIYSNAQNTNNAYLADYANMLNNLGQQYYQSASVTREINDRNKAKQNDYLSTAATQLGQWSQVQQQMKNQKSNDQMVLPYLLQFLKQGFTSDMVNNTANMLTNLNSN